MTQSQKENRPPPETQKTDAVVRPAGGARQTAVSQYVKYLKKNTNISRSIAEDVERNQKESLEKKIKISDNPLKGMSSRSGFAEEKMGGLEDIVETAQTKAKREELKNTTGDSTVRECRPIRLSPGLGGADQGVGKTETS